MNESTAGGAQTGNKPRAGRAMGPEMSRPQIDPLVTVRIDFAVISDEKRVIQGANEHFPSLHSRRKFLEQCSENGTSSATPISSALA
jgi:hypothetical protein